MTEFGSFFKKLFDHLQFLCNSYFRCNPQNRTSTAIFLMVVENVTKPPLIFDYDHGEVSLIFILIFCSQIPKLSCIWNEFFDSVKIA